MSLVTLYGVSIKKKDEIWINIRLFAIERETKLPKASACKIEAATNVITSICVGRRMIKMVMILKNGTKIYSFNCCRCRKIGYTFFKGSSGKRKCGRCVKSTSIRPTKEQILEARQFMLEKINSRVDLKIKCLKCSKENITSYDPAKERENAFVCFCGEYNYYKIENREVISQRISKKKRGQKGGCG